MYKQFSVISKRNFKFMSKVNRDCTGLSLQRYVVGPENLRSLFNQSDAKPNPFAFVRAFSCLLTESQSSWAHCDVNSFSDWPL